ncbi:MAG: DUF2953 domain-containing protein [Oscillospiraceae bacterium]|nr:DUF2953 domain-containing protein [Oscillospiraceae bacterium]
MTALIVVLGVLLAIGFLPIGICAEYEEDAKASLTVAGIPIVLYPPKKKKGKKEKSHVLPKEEKEKKPLPPLPQLLETYLPPALKVLGLLKRKLLIRRLKLHAYFGGSDPCDSALNYGKAWAAIGMVMPLLEGNFRIGKRDVGAFLQKDEKKIRLLAKLHITLTVGRILQIAIYALYLLLKARKSNDTEKAVQ